MKGIREEIIDKKEYARQFRIHERIQKYLKENDRTMEEESVMILSKLSNLSASEREYVINYMIYQRQEEAKLLKEFKNIPD